MAVGSAVWAAVGRAAAKEKIAMKAIGETEQHSQRLAASPQLRSDLPTLRNMTNAPVYSVSGFFRGGLLSLDFT